MAADETGLPKKLRDFGAGLHNIGNTCFLNSVLQAITHTSYIVKRVYASKAEDICLDEQECLRCVLWKHIKCAFESRQTILPEAVITQMYSGGRFEYNQQQDAQELLQWLINALDECNRKNHNDYTMIPQIFSGELMSTVVCMKCGATSQNLERFTDLGLDIEYAKSVTVALRRFFRKEILQDSHMCEICKNRGHFSKIYALIKVPETLILHIKRFSFRKNKALKNLDFFKYPESLTVKIASIKAVGTGIAYQLRCVVVHTGKTISCGHYTTYTKSNLNVWYLMDDTEVKKVPQKEALSAEAYLLFYEKVRETAHTDTVLRAPSSPFKLSAHDVSIQQPSREQSGTIVNSSVSDEQGQRSELEMIRLENVRLKQQNMDLKRALEDKTIDFNKLMEQHLKLKKTADDADKELQDLKAKVAGQDTDNDRTMDGQNTSAQKRSHENESPSRDERQSEVPGKAQRRADPKKQPTRSGRAGGMKHKK